MTRSCTSHASRPECATVAADGALECQGQLRSAQVRRRVLAPVHVLGLEQVVEWKKANRGRCSVPDAAPVRGDPPSRLRSARRLVPLSS